MNPPSEKTTHRKILTPNRTKGMFLVLIAWIFFTLAIAFSRKASEASSVPTVLLFQNFLSLVVMVPLIIARGKKALHLSKYGLFLIRSLAGYMSFAFTFMAIRQTSLVNVVLLSNSAPLFIPLIIWFWRKVKIGRRLWIGIIIGFLGIGIILQPNCNVINIGAVFALGAAVCFAFSMILQRRLLKTESIYTILFYYFLISTIISTPFAIETWKPFGWDVWRQLLIVGICFVIGQLCFLSSLRYEKPSFLSAFNYSAIVYGAVLEWLMWNQFPGWICIFGILIVCTGGFIVIAEGKVPPMAKGP